MQATEVVETASGKGYHSNGNIQKDEPSNRKKENLLSPNGCKEAKLTFLDYDWDSLALEKRANDKEISNIDKIELLEPSFTVSPNAKMESTHSQSSEFEGGIDNTFLNETYSIHHSESKLKNESLTHLDSEFNYEMQKRKEVFFDILNHRGNTTVGLERIYKISDDDSEDVQKHDLDDDSQQEYHSAEEQEYINNHLSFDQTKTLNISNLEVWGLRSSGYGVNCASNLDDDHVKLESNSSTSSDSADVYGQEGSPHVSKFQNSVMVREYHEPKHGKCVEQDTSSMYHTVFDAVVLKGSPLEHQESQSKSGFLNPQKALKTKIYTGKVKSQVTKSKDFCGNSVVEEKMLQHLENPSTLPQDKVLETLLQPYKDCQSSWTSIFDDSVISACYKSLENTPNPALDFSVTLPRSAVRDNQAIEEGSSLRAANGSTTNKACFHHMEGPCPESVTDVASCTVTVNQTVDVSTDFRACFTTSRATSTRSSVVSTSSNTEITMINKKWPDEWQSEKRSVACNTDWAYSQDNEDPQMAVTKGCSGKSVSVDSLKPKGNFLNKDSLELRKTFDFTDLKKHSEREPQLSKEMEKNLPSKCCQQIMQRAIKAELHLLNVHYQMCHQHCSDIYKLVMENREGLNRNLSSNSTKKELGSALLTVLEDLKVRYVNLKEKINKGIPLEELPPLSVESKLLSTFSAFASRLMKEESHIFSGADSELDNQSTRDVDGSSSLKKTLSHMSLLPDNSHPKQDTSPKEEGLKNGDVDIDFSQLKLDDKDSTNYREISEDWFDAKENVTGADFSGIQENQIVQDKEDPKFTLEMKNVEPLRRDKGYLIHVGGLCPSVSEADLRSHFKKYEISDISIYDSSPNYRYASLALKKNHNAKLAVKEMNGTEINGKSVNVRLVKTPGEYTSPLSSKNGNKVSFSNLEKNISKEVNSTSSVSRLPRTRPRQQLGSEQDSEFFAFDQKGVKKNCKQIGSTKLLPDAPFQFVPPNTSNLRSFTKIMERLAELHPKAGRDHIRNALQEVRMHHKGSLSGLSVNAIVRMTSSVLENSASG
ncbi:RNA-binding protein 44 [Neophocaena asiaeorientalis asiaeorientalis]|uniref:RNA-binding protein 44 n=1 Tax=Neophocaena asiaeorientalis asiaeorientalis TaxID=1706337 RepID=A0A341C149_NEOAA|nr:RNA-binding protein 44 [Neophocaena asiaeorientalis asiaeorientalis]